MRWRVVPANPYYPRESFGMGMQAMSERRGRGPIGDAIADARRKLIDEGWFGRRSSEPSGSSSLGWELDAPKPRTAEESMALLSFEEAWATREPPMDKLDLDHDLGIGIDH